MEIGSIFEVNPDEAKKAGTIGTLHLAQVEKYGKKNQCYTASGREAIELALISLERERPDISKCRLMPAYMCDSVFLPFLHRGWELAFYSVDRALETAGEEIFRLSLECDPGLIFIHPYYGADTCKVVRKQMQALRKSGIMVMEDVTQSYYLEEAGRTRILWWEACVNGTRFPTEDLRLPICRLRRTFYGMGKTTEKKD